MKTPLPLFSAVLVTGLLLPATSLIFAADPGLTPALQFSTGLAGGQNKLTWSAQPGARYRIRSSGDLSPTAWRARALVEGEGSWLDPEPAGARAFYQVEPPQPEVFMVEPAVLSPGGVLVISGQCLPPGSSVVFEIDGQPPVSAPIVTGADGRMTVTLPAFDIIIAAGKGCGPHVRLARVTGPDGATVCVIGQTFEATLSGFARDAPPELPPAYKTSEAKNTFGAIRRGGRTAPVPNIPPIPGMCPSVAMLSAPLSLGTFSRIPGEVCVQQCDLSLATPAGPPLEMVRTYRSMAQNTAGQGTGWDHAYNMSIEEIFDVATDPSPTRVAVHSGDGRVDVLQRRGDVYVSDGMFREVRVIGLKKYGMFFADQGSCSFHAMDGSPKRGKLEQVADRNGVAITCAYDAAGKLTSVSSQFGQSLAFARDTAGRVVMVTDQTGRFVSYSYYGAGDPDGNPGDLKAVSCPQLPGQPPLRGATVFRYTTGSTDPRLNSNLRSVQDGADRLVTAWTYSSATSPLAVDYDRCVTCDRQSIAPADPLVHFSYEFIAPGGGGAGGILCISNDELGRVTETRCDRMHRPVSVRAFTTFARPGLPVTSTANRPLAPLDDTQPAFLETTCTWNADSQCTRCTEPDGLQTRTTYDRDLRRDCLVRERGNARVITLVCPDATEPPRTVSCDYLPGYGTCEGKKGLNAVNVSLARTGRTLTTPRTVTRVDAWAAIVERVTLSGFQEAWPCRYKAPSLEKSGPKKIQSWVKDCYDGRDMVTGAGIWGGEDGDGGCTQDMGGNPIRGLGVKGGRNPGGNVAGRAVGGDDDDDCDSGPDDSAMRPGGPIKGQLVKCGKNPGGDLVERTVSSNPLYNDNGMQGSNPMFERSFPTRLSTTLGQAFTWSYDSRGNGTASTTPLAGSGTRCTWNSLGQCTGVTVLNGPDSSFHTAPLYDPATHYQNGAVVDDDVDGTGTSLALTITVERNALGLITRVVDPRGFDTLVSYNACDQPVSLQSPPLGPDPVAAARVRSDQFYDAGGLPVRCDLEHRDASGALVLANPAYTGFCVYDRRGRLVLEATEQQPVNVPPGLLSPAGLDMAQLNPKEYTLDRAGQCVRISIPASSRGQAADAVCDFEWDTLGRVSGIISGGSGDPGAVTTKYTYTLRGMNSNVRSTARVAPAGAVSPTVTFTYDAWRRPSTCTDEMGNVTTWSYENDGFVTVSVYGEVTDIPGSANNVLLARGRGRGSDGLVFNVVNPRAARDNHLQGGVDIVQAGGMAAAPHAINTKGTGTAGRAAGSKLVREIEYARYRYPQLMAMVPGPAFFDVFNSDDVWTAERFAPGAPAPHATETTTVHHSPAGLPLSVSRNGDTLCTFGYDTAGRTIATANPATLTRTCTLDACGNVTSSTVFAHSTIAGTPDETFTTAATYDAAGRRTSTTDGGGNTRSRTFDSLGRSTSETLPGGLTVTCEYDVAGSTGFSSRIVAADLDGDGLAETLERGVCLAGECRSVTDALGYTTTFTNDNQGRRTRCDFPDNTFETCAFDVLGNPVLHQRKNGAVIAADFNYKAQSYRMAYSHLPAGVVPVPPTEYAYDGLGHCVLVTEGASTVACTFDSLGNCLGESQNGHTVTHSFDHRGSNGVTYPDGSQYRMTRNDKGLLIDFSIVTATGVVLTPPLSHREYAGGYEIREVRRDGVTTTRDYRSDGEPPLPLAGTEDFSFAACVRTTITGPTGTVLEDHLTRRNADQCETVQHRVFGSGAAPSRRQTFTLDHRNLAIRCLTQVRAVAGGPVTLESDVNYVLDARGRRVSINGSGAGSASGLYTSSELLPPGDRQMGRYSSWPGGSLFWDDNGNLTHLSRGTAASMDLVYDAESRLAGTMHQNTGTWIDSYAYDGLDRRISSTRASNDPASPPVTTFFLYDGPDCIQELDGNFVPEMSYAVSAGINHCIITKNGSTLYPHSGGNSTDFVYPYIPADIPVLKEIEIDDDIHLRILPPGPRIGHCYDATCALLTSSTGQPSERFASDDSLRPIFLTSDGLVRPGATSALSGYRWLQPGAAWCPETLLFQTAAGLYSPELGQPVSAHKTKPGPKKEYVGHVSIMK